MKRRKRKKQGATCGKCFLKKKEKKEAMGNNGMLERALGSGVKELMW